MTDVTLPCPHCGGAICVNIAANPGATGSANPAQSAANPAVAQGILEPSSNGARPYNQGYTQDFLEFWSVYPLHRDKRKAQSAWRKSVVRLGATASANPAEAKAQIIAGAIRYRDDPNRDPSYTKYAEGWLNADGWEDEPLPPRGQSRLSMFDRLKAADARRAHG